MMLKNVKKSDYWIKKIAWHFCVDIPASKTAELLGINRNTINRYYMIFRRCIFLEQSVELQSFRGIVELDESYFGARRIRGNKTKLKRGRGTLKQPVFGIFERNGRVYTEIVPDCAKETLQGIVLGKVSLESVINTDGWPGYSGLVDVGYDKHYRVNHSANEFSAGNGKHINGIESFWSFTKRRLSKFNGVKPYFLLHLKESEWRWGAKPENAYQNLLALLKKYKHNQYVNGADVAVENMENAPDDTS
jgi:transposase-like protein